MVEGVLDEAEDEALVEEVLDVVEDEVLGAGVEDGFNELKLRQIAIIISIYLGTKVAFNVSESLVL